MESNYSRFPVGKNSLDNCLGIIRGSHLLKAHLSGPAVSLESLLQAPLYVAENAHALNAIEQFKETGIHTALVTDEYGGIGGIIILTDLMKAMLCSFQPGRCVFQQHLEAIG
jgi:putative hemolysin